MEKIILNKNNLRKFGLIMGSALVFIAVIILSRHQHSTLPVSIISAAFFVSALVAPNLLKPAYIVWMKLAFILGWINTRMILFILFYLIFTPMGLIMKLFGKDPLERNIDKSKDSYWHRKEQKAPNILDYQRQF